MLHLVRDKIREEVAAEGKAIGAHRLLPSILWIVHVAIDLNLSFIHPCHCYWLTYHFQVLSPCL